MIIAMTGASGFIGSRLSKDFQAAGHEVRAIRRGESADDPLRGASTVVHLAGEPVAQRWTSAAKQRIRDSRVAGTRKLVEAIARLRRKPDALICASAVGYYGSRGDEVLTESSPPGDSWLSEVCVEWEREAQAAEALGVRVVRMRTGIVLDPAGGALKSMLPPFKWGIGGRLGSGAQWMPWVHVVDLCALFQFAVSSEVRGAINAVAPNPVTNREFTRALASAVHRPAVIPVPAFALKLLFGEMSEVLLASDRVVPAAAEEAGFRYKHPELGLALADLFGNRN